MYFSQGPEYWEGAERGGDGRAQESSQELREHPRQLPQRQGLPQDGRRDGQDAHQLSQRGYPELSNKWPGRIKVIITKDCWKYSFKCNSWIQDTRKTEAAQLKKEAIQAASSKKDETALKGDNPSKDEPKIDTTSAGTGVSSEAKVEAGKKKEYTVNVLSEVVDNNIDQNQRTGLPTDPAEFAKQERLRKQREKQVRVKIRRENFMFTIYKPRHFFQAKFQQEIVKKKNTGSESDQSAAFKENNLLVEDGMDMWDALSQIPEMGKPWS